MSRSSEHDSSPARPSGARPPATRSGATRPWRHDGDGPQHRGLQKPRRLPGPERRGHAVERTRRLANISETLLQRFKSDTRPVIAGGYLASVNRPDGTFTDTYGASPRFAG